MANVISPFRISGKRVVALSFSMALGEGLFDMVEDSYVLEGWGARGLEAKRGENGRKQTA